MSNFHWALQKTLHHEGGFVDNPADPGGATYRGVSLRFLRSEGIDIDGDGDIDINDIRALADNKTDDMLDTIYFKHFWQPAKCDKITSELISAKVFDMAVNMGIRQAWRITQRAAGELLVDGLVGPKSIERVRQLDSQDYFLLAKMRTEQTKFYLDLMVRKPELNAFRLGWMRRAVQ